MFKKFSEKIREEFIKALEQSSKFVSDLKANESNGTFEVIITKQVKDRDGEIVLVDGIDVENYLKNPIVLFGHDYRALPIGKTMELNKGSDQIIAKGFFAPADANPLAQNIRKLYDAKILQTTSIGFIPQETEGNLITRCELLEFSFVPVPANPEALSLIAEQGLEKEFKAIVEHAVKKGFQVDEQYVKFVKNIKETEPEKPAEEKDNKDEEIKELKETISDEFKLLTGEIKEVKEEIKNLGEKLGELASQVVKGEEGQNDEKTAELEGILKDTHQKAQLIDRIVNQLNENLKKIK